MAADPINLAAGAPLWSRGRSEAGLSIVIPVFNEAAGLPALHQRVAEVARRLKDTRRLPVEVIYVDDGSHDATLSIARELPADEMKRASRSDRKSTRLNSSHDQISYAVFCLKK